MLHSFDNKIIIIGSGPGALSCAYKLLLSGIRPVTIEGGSAPGGFMKTISYNDYQVDIGRKELYSRIKEVDELWASLLKEDYLEYDYRVGILYKGNILEKHSSYVGITRGLEYKTFFLGIIDYIYCFPSINFNRI